MLARSIDPEAFGPTFDEKIFVVGKRICIVSAIAAVSIAALDLVNASAVTTVAAALREGRMHYDELPNRLLAGIHDISIYPDRSTVVVAIPRDSIASLPKVASLSRPAATLYEPAKPAPAVAQSAAALPPALPKREESKLAVARPAPSPATKPTAQLIKNNPIVAELAAARHGDAVEMAMLPPADSQRPGVFALASLPVSMDITPTPAVAKEARTVSAAAAAVPPVTDAHAAPVQLASLDVGSLPSSVAASPAALQITLPPLSMVPMPIPAPGVPPPSPAQRLKLEGKDYAKAERCLANAIYWEARSEPVRGQMAVAQVVMNRVFSGFYPSDVCGVVYQNANRHLACQFTFACDGKRKVITERGHWARANRIAKQTLDGQIYVPEVAKSTHYHASYVHPNWVREMRKMVRYGLHSFYRPYAWGNGAEEPVWGKTAMAKVETKKK
ncbi:hypothetical protein ASD45_17985 [Pseudolabrys sp. Root1462]|uniref:cell wall hydrolase n=1 Tax=Pseudolabrys sp. Root1462 TaxID=1736466 RepID=UPI000702A81E|nr:cell wall hydrolase [Pseudolabrys sp. Root1462]KQY97889.1 hypothetical protein ASD45_17985 [Pseudolabrys sp. Root1462]